MFEARGLTAGGLKTVLTALTNVLDVNFKERDVYAATVDCAEVGINVQVVDVFKVTLVVLKLEPDHFGYYRCDSSIHVCVNLAQLLKVFQFSNQDDNVSLRSSKNENSWDIVFASANGTTCSEFSMALLNDEQLRYIIPDVTFDAVLEISAHEFSRITTILSNFGSNIMVTWTEGTISFSTSGCSGSGHVRVSPGPVMNVLREGSIEFSARYLCLIAEASSFSNTVKLAMSGSQFPSIVEFEVPTGDGKSGTLQYYVCPLLTDNNLDNNNNNTM